MFYSRRQRAGRRESAWLPHYVVTGKTGNGKTGKTHSSIALRQVSLPTCHPVYVLQKGLRVGIYLVVNGRDACRLLLERDDSVASYL